MVVPKYRKWLEEASKIGGMNTHCERSSSELSGTSSDGEKLELFSDSFFAVHGSLSYQLASCTGTTTKDIVLLQENCFRMRTLMELIGPGSSFPRKRNDERVTERKREEKDDDEMSVRRLKSSASVDSGFDPTVQSTPETLHCDNAAWTVFGLAYSHQLEKVDALPHRRKRVRK
ncbi:uncharacterized protein BBA_05093 [Beauveria bassiana ARSEF 2860]|uniref:Uncharacterized protein n=1 Tax=Beauveria bassiana (strain ARSEF 2860) TaxID=655819 RepID=J4UMK1_BEAB2|nr:uncharacterized protein BBA_05093 [Beauveria bassiana ARSEF 2860]EJP66122.1 hypothetical protein BBA_05093 [Beauveria bassiana ARSEF 2860]